MPGFLQAQAALEALVARLRTIGPPGWAQIFAAFEYKIDDGEPSFTWVLLGVVALDERWGFGQFDQDAEVFDLAMAHHDAARPPWTALELLVDADGSFDGTPSYDPVPADGTFDPARQDRLESYPQTWADANGEVPPVGRGGR